MASSVPNRRRCIDDTLLYEENIEKLFWHTMRYIDKCSRNGIVFNPYKFEFGHDSVDFAGFEIGPDGYKPTQKMLNAIATFPTPTNITGIRSWFSLVKQVNYAYSLSSKMDPFRDLLSSKKNFYWDDSLDQLFLQARLDIVRLVSDGVKSFKLGIPTMVTPDFSKKGLGFFLRQKKCHCSMDDAPHCGPDHWALILVGSRVTHDAESRYAPVEGEALALAFALESTRVYTLGDPKLLVGTDHKPLHNGGSCSSMFSSYFLLT